MWRDEPSPDFEADESVRPRNRAQVAWVRMMWRIMQWWAASYRQIIQLTAERRLLPMRRGHRVMDGPDPYQQACHHPAAATVRGGNQYAHWTKCRRCGLRLS